MNRANTTIEMFTTVLELRILGTLILEGHFSNDVEKYARSRFTEEDLAKLQEFYTSNEWEINYKD